MPHSPTSPLFAALIMLLATGCAFEDGDPWAVAEFDLELRNTGSIEAVEGISVTLLMASNAQPAAADDHGHAHDEAEEPAAEEGVFGVTATSHDTIELTDGLATVEFEECSDECRLPLGDFQQVELRFEAVTLASERVEVDATVSAELTETIDRDHTGGRLILMQFELPDLQADNVETAAQQFAAQELTIEIEEHDHE